jgi:circadian clock protein KaiC
VRDFEQRVIVLDPASNLEPIGTHLAITEHNMRQLDHFKSQSITTVANVLTDFGEEQPQMGISSLVDTWIAIRCIELDGELSRTLRVVKSRGMPHSNQIREFAFGGDGVELRHVYLGRTGSSPGPRG